MRQRPELRQGRIVIALLKDKNGFGKRRPAVILSDDAEIARHPDFIVAAVTTTFSDPPPDDVVPIPWHPRGHPVTGLRQRSGVVTSWIVTLTADDVVDLVGDVPSKILAKIVPTSGT